MPKVDLSTHNAGIWIMLALDLVFLGATLWVYKCDTATTELRTIMSGAFAGWNGALLVALRGGSSQTKE